MGLALDRQRPLKQGAGARLGAEAPQHLGLLDQTQGQRRMLGPERPFLDGGRLFELAQCVLVAALLFVELGQILQADGQRRMLGPERLTGNIPAADQVRPCLGIAPQILEHERQIGQAADNARVGEPQMVFINPQGAHEQRTRLAGLTRLLEHEGQVVQALGHEGMVGAGPLFGQPQELPGRPQGLGIAPGSVELGGLSGQFLKLRGRPLGRGPLFGPCARRGETAGDTQQNDEAASQPHGMLLRLAQGAAGEEIAWRESF